MNAPERDARVDAAVVAPLRDARTELDEVHQARLAAAIEEALDAGAMAQPRSAAPARPRRGAWIAGAAAVWAAAALAVVLWAGAAGRGHHPRAGAPLPPASQAAAPRSLPLLVPQPEAGGAAVAAGAAPSTSLVALRGERARATVDGRVRLTLVGPGRVAVLPAARDGDIELALEAGALLVDYDGHARGGTLRVRSPGALTTVVGTLFAVEATPAGSRVSVARGRVRAEAASGREWQIAAGSSWTSSDGGLTPIAGALAADLAEHELGWTAAAPAAPGRERGEHAPRRSAPPAAGPDLDALYADAEAAMRARSLADARRTLEIIAGRDPRGRLGEAALLDLARLALADSDRAEARRALARLPQPLADPALAETAEHLRCRANDSCTAPPPGGD